MNSYSFADIYRSAKIALEPTTMVLRQNSAERFLKGRSFVDSLGLVRLHLGLAAPELRDRLVEVFRTDDGTFSIVDNDRELMVLSTGLLAAIVISGDSATTLAIVTASFSGKRVAAICPDLGEWAKAKLVEFATQNRGRNLEASAQFPKPAQSKAPAQIDAWIQQAPDFPKLAPILKQMSEEADAHLGVETARAHITTTLLVNEIRELREELEMLWWNVGGYSTQLNVPFSEVSRSAVPLVSGIELGGLTYGKVGPAAIGALVQLKLKACNVNASLKISDAINAAVITSVVAPSLAESDPLTELCPLLTAIRLRRSIGDSAWTAAFNRLTGIDATAEMPALDLAMQIYREILLVKCRTQK